MTEMPTWMADQLGATIRDVQQGMQRTAREWGQALGDARRDPWLASLVDQLMAGLLRREVALCGHLAAPQPVFTAAWNLKALTCIDCMRGAFSIEDRDPIEDRTCDRCRVDTGGRIHPNLLNAGPVLIGCGLCTTCNDESRRRTRVVVSGVK